MPDEKPPPEDVTFSVVDMKDLNTLLQWAKAKAPAIPLEEAQAETEPWKTKTPKSAKTGGMNAYVAAQQIRAMVRDLQKTHSHSAVIDEKRMMTDASLLTLSGLLGSRIKVAMRRSGFDQMKVRLKEEREVAKYYSFSSRIKQLHELVQHLPTQPNLPTTDAENTVRAVAALTRSTLMKIETTGVPCDPSIVTALKAIGQIVSMEVLAAKDVPNFLAEQNYIDQDDDDTYYEEED